MGARRILVVDAGGTIAQVRAGSELGYEQSDAPLAFLSVEERELLAALAHVEGVRLFAKDSTVITPTDWGLIAEAITARLREFDGFVVTHGTDSLAYTASALSWMLGQLDRPVVVTGAQMPMRDASVQGRSDGWSNLVNAVKVAVDGRIPEVSVVFGSQVLRGNRSTKSRVTFLDAFESPSFPALAHIGREIAYSPFYLAPECAISAPSRPSSWPHLAFLKAFPGLSPATVARLLDDCDGCVVEVFSSGSLPPQLLRTLHESRRPCVLSLPGGTGITDSFRYEPAYWHEEELVVSARDMTREAAITKLTWALADGRAPAEAVELVRRNLAGEMQTRTLPYEL